MKKKYTLKQKIMHWFDDKMSHGSMSLLKLLMVLNVIVWLVNALIMQADGVLVLGEYDTFGARLYSSFSAIISPFMPYFSDGSTGYKLHVGIVVMYGFFFGSMTFGIIATALQEKMESLKKGNIPVMEEDHVIVLGFQPGEYTLVQELVYGADQRKRCIVVAGESERDEMEDAIRANVKCPKNVRILCRSVNIFDPNDLEICSIDTCSTVLISPMDSDSTVHAILSVTKALHQNKERDVCTVAVLPENDYRIPMDVLSEYNILILHTSDTIAKIMAHVCTQPGLSRTMMEVFHFDGSEMHVVSLPGTEGMTFEELVCRVDDASPLGIFKGNKVYLNPPSDMRLEKGDRLLVFCEESDSAKLTEQRELPQIGDVSDSREPQKAGKVVIIGCNAFLPTIVFELPENVPEAILANVPVEAREEILHSAAQRETPMRVTFFEKNISETETLEELVKIADHVVLLSLVGEEDEKVDMQNIFTIITLRNIRERLGLNFNITAEMLRENNQNLLIPDNDTEFVVSSNMSSLFLTQLSETPELVDVFSELLTNDGNEIFLKSALEMGCEGSRTVLEVRRRLLQQQYLMIGYMKTDSLESVYDLPLGKTIQLNPEDKLIVIGEN